MASFVGSPQRRPRGGSGEWHVRHACKATNGTTENANGEEQSMEARGQAGYGGATGDSETNSEKNHAQVPWRAIYTNDESQQRKNLKKLIWKEKAQRKTRTYAVETFRRKDK